MDSVTLAWGIAFVRFYLDGSSEYWQQAAATESAGAAMLNIASVYQAVLGNPFFGELEKKYGFQLRKVLENQSSLAQAGLELMAREEELKNEYQQIKATLRCTFRGEEYSEGQLRAKFSSPDRQVRIEVAKSIAKAVLEQKKALSAILLELVSLRDQIARVNGFDNYLEYANRVHGRFDYGEKELTAFCEQVKAELVPVMKKVYQQRCEQLGLDELLLCDRELYFADGNPQLIGDADALVEHAQQMFEGLSPAFGQFFTNLRKTESVDIAPSDTKPYGICFAANFSEHFYPFIFGNCNGSTHDISSFVHEMGHAWQMHLTAQHVALNVLREMPTDMAEIPSRTMELLSLPFAELFFGKDASKYRHVHFRKFLEATVGYCTLHEMNTWLYTHVGASVEEMAVQFERINNAYGECRSATEQENREGAQLLNNMALFTFPRYVISYALSDMCALDLFSLQQQDPGKAWEAYETLCQYGGSLSYPQLLEKAGLEPAYAPGRVKKVAEYAQQYMGL